LRKRTFQKRKGKESRKIKSRLQISWKERNGSIKKEKKDFSRPVREMGKAKVSNKEREAQGRHFRNERRKTEGKKKNSRVP